MAAKRKQVDDVTYQGVKKYFLSAIVDGRIADMLEIPNTSDVDALTQLLEGPEAIDELNQWMMSNLSASGRRGLWDAIRSNDYQKSKPGYKRRLKEETFKLLEDYRKEKKLSSIDAAVVHLLNQK